MESMARVSRYPSLGPTRGPLIAVSRFCEEIRIDPNDCWIRFVRNPESKPAQSPFKTFMDFMIDSSRKERLVLDERERAPVQTLKNAGSAVEIWRRLAQAADRRVLWRARKSEPSLPKLKWNREEEGSQIGP